jgi:hypothetical protein
VQNAGKLLKTITIGRKIANAATDAEKRANTNIRGLTIAKNVRNVEKHVTDIITWFMECALYADTAFLPTATGNIIKSSK